MMRCLAQVPHLMHRGREAKTKRKSGQEELFGLRHEMITRCETFKPILASLRDRYEANEEQLRASNAQLTPGQYVLRAHYERMYCLGLAVSIILNCVLAGLGQVDMAIAKESQSLADIILAFNESAQKYRPIAASYMSLCLTVAWVGASEQRTRDAAQLLLADYAQDFTGSTAFISLESLEWMAGRLHLETHALGHSYP